MRLLKFLKMMLMLRLPLLKLGKIMFFSICPSHHIPLPHNSPLKVASVTSQKTLFSQLLLYNTLTIPTKWTWSTQDISSRKVSTFLRSKPVRKTLFTSLFLAAGVASYVLFRKNTLTEKEKKSLKNLSISSMSSPLSESQTRLTVESLEKHLKGRVPLGFSKLRKKDPFHEQLGLPCSLIVKADREGHIAKVYKTYSIPPQESGPKPYSAS
ncbi:MAG: hypothetical protein ACI9S8_000442 [Chlamydiales bacterium]|jgi:hypothetical protein